MKRKTILIITFIYICFNYLIISNFKSQKSLINIKTKLIKVELLYSNVRSNKTNIKFVEFSGEYEELLSKEIFNNENKYKIEDIYFLLTTNSKRIRYTINLIKFWSKNVNKNCLIIFEEKDFLLTEGFKEYLISNQIKCQIELSNLKRYEERYFQLIQIGNKFIQKNSKEYKWFAIGDDDTIWFINNLLKILEQYNSSKLIYLGNISDRNDSIQRHGNYFAYGGAGILLSKPLVSLVSKYSQQCQQKFRYSFGGDEIIGKCLTNFLKVNLTKNKNFHQIDHEGNIEGLFQSGINGLVTLHHIFSLWEPFPPEHIKYEKDILNTIEIAYQHFQFNFLKRFFKINYHRNETLLLTIGYSFTLFNRILSLEELNQVELTWYYYSQLYQTKTRPKENKKINWFFKKLTNNYSNQSIYQNNDQQIQITFNN